MSLLSWGLYSGRATHKEKGNNAKLSTYDLWRLLAKYQAQSLQACPTLLPYGL